jgi:hypothetical protein
VERLRERRGPERSKIERQLFRQRCHPSRIPTVLPLGFGSRFFDHLLIRVEPDDFGV